MYRYFLILKMPPPFWITLGNYFVTPYGSLPYWRKVKEFLHTEFWFPMLFITTLAQSEGVAISLARGLCCLTLYCIWVKRETCFWIFFSFCETAHCLGTCIYRALGTIPYLSHYYFFLCKTLLKSHLQDSKQWGERQRRNIDNGYLLKKILHLPVSSWMKRRRKGPTVAKTRKRKKKLKDITLIQKRNNQLQHIYITHTTWSCMSKGLKILPTVSSETRSQKVYTHRRIPPWSLDSKFILSLRTQFVEMNLNCGAWQFLLYIMMKAWSKYLLSWIHFRSAVSSRWWDFWRIFLRVQIILRKKAEQNTLAGKSTIFYPWRGPLLVCLKVSVLREN